MSTRHPRDPGPVARTGGPRWHVRPDSGWLNDPNGPIRWDGRYHLFFQHNPATPVHGDIHWGHVSSPDLLTWRPEPVALAPVPGGPDEAGVWSGCTVDDGGTPTAVYSGVRDDTGLSAVCLATSTDGLRTWRQDPEPVVPAPTGLAGFRDPFVFSAGGHRWGLVGGGDADGTPFIELFACDDLRAWRPCGRLLDGSHPLAARLAPATVWECPALVRLGDHWVLVVSLWTDGELGPVAWLSGTLEPAGAGLRLAPGRGGRVDAGSDFYAPTTLVDGSRVLMWGWSWECSPAAVVARRGWAGVLTCPRELGTDADGALHVRPARELTGLRARRLVHERLALAAGTATSLGDLPPGAEVLLQVTHGERLALVLRRGSADRVLAVDVDVAAGRVTLDRAGWPAERARRTGSVRTAGGSTTVRVLLDDSVVEVFVDDRWSVTERVDTLPGDAGVLEVASVAGAVGASVDAWELLPPAP